MKDKSVIVVDDGIETGVTAAAAGRYLKTLSPKKLILAVPVGPIDINPMVADQYDDVFCLEHVMNFKAVAFHYENFPQVSDREVLKILEDYYPKTNWSDQGL